MAFDWIGTALRNEAQPTKAWAVTAAIARAVLYSLVAMVTLVVAGVYAALLAKVFLWGWGLGW